MQAVSARGVLLRVGNYVSLDSVLPLKYSDPVVESCKFKCKGTIMESQKNK